MSDLVLGGIYNFNQVRAEVLFLEPPVEATTVVWREARGPYKRKVASEKMRHTPSWYFEKYARLLP